MTEPQRLATVQLAGARGQRGSIATAYPALTNPRVQPLLGRVFTFAAGHRGCGLSGAVFCQSAAAPAVDWPLEAGTATG